MNFENIFTPYKARKLTEVDVPDILDLYLENTEYFKNCVTMAMRLSKSR